MSRLFSSPGMNTPFPTAYFLRAWLHALTRPCYKTAKLNKARQKENNIGQCPRKLLWYTNLSYHIPSLPDIMCSSIILLLEAQEVNNGYSDLM
jgi:hypothetical protein